LHSLEDRIALYAVTENERVTGHRLDLPGRESNLLPPLLIDEEFENGRGGRVTLAALHLGRGGAAHGGVLALIPDDAMGMLVSTRLPTRVHTAHLHVDFRSLAEIGVPRGLRRRWIGGKSGSISFPDASGRTTLRAPKRTACGCISGPITPNTGNRSGD
jgi:hypothetical protein